MVKEQIEMVVPMINLHPLLTFDETEAASQFQEEGFNLAQDRRLEILLGVGVFQAEKVEHIGIAKDQVGRELVFLAKLFQLLPDELVRLLGKRGYSKSID